MRNMISNKVLENIASLMEDASIEWLYKEEEQGYYLYLFLINRKWKDDDAIEATKKVLKLILLIEELTYSIRETTVLGKMIRNERQNLRHLKHLIGEEINKVK